MPRALLSLAGLLSLALLAGLGFRAGPGETRPAAPAASPPAGPPGREIIAFTAMRPTNLDLWLHETPGAPARRLTDDPALDTNAVFSPDGRWIVFSSERRGNPDLWALDLSRPGAAPRPLTTSPAMEDAPAFSPDGRRLAFVSTRDGNADIWAMDFVPEGDGEKGAVNLTRSPGGDFTPSFSPDGRRIAFASDRDAYRQGEIYVMGSDGSGPRRLTHSSGWDGSPAWSADGASVLFYSDREGGTSIWRVAADAKAAEAAPQRVGSGEALSPARAPGGRLGFAVRDGDGWKVVTTDAAGGAERPESEAGRDCRAPDFDARGRMVCHGPGPLEDAPRIGTRPPRGPFVVAGGRAPVTLPDRVVDLLPVRLDFPALDPTARKLVTSTGHDRLVISDLDGGNSREISPRGDGRTWAPVWSPDGQWIAASVGPTFSGPGAEVDVWKLRPDGSGAVNLTEGSGGNDALPAFSRDGRRMVFRSGRDGNAEIYLADADGRNPVRLTDHPATDTMPDISPRGDQVAFTSDRGGDFDLYVLPVGPRGATGAPRAVAPARGFDMHPKYSPDGEWLVFASERGGINDEEPLLTLYNPQPYGEIWAVRVRDGRTVRLTHNQYEDGTPAWGRIPE